MNAFNMKTERRADSLITFERPAVHTLYAVGEFRPPAGISPTKFELNNVFKDEDYMTNVVVEDDLQRQLSLPKPVQDLLMDADGSFVKPGFHYPS